jgi:16S rRNA C967 or C1407 C5-methylase (RsmB/RsmF family)
VFERYAPFIPDFDAFQAALRRPRDLYLRVNRLRIDPQDFARRMRGWGHALEPVPWFPCAFRASPELMKTRATLEYFLGLYYIQGAPSMIPPLALDPKPGERVLDLCAAPGSKTTQMCEMMGDEGLVVANDIYIDRLKILKGHVERLGITCALLTRKHGDSFPGGIPFQRVLVDAPCSGEGTMRGPAAFGRGRRPRRDEERAAPADSLDGDAEAPPGKEYTEEDLRRLHALQRALLRRAANLCEPGGTIVYSTCTYSPLENECVVDEVLRARDDLELEEVPLDVPAEPGLTEWEGRKFKPAMRKCLRFYPHRLNSWGFFVARMKRRARSERSAFHGAEEARFAEIVRPVEGALEARARALATFEERFGVAPAAFERFAVHDFGPAMWLGSRAMPHPSRLGGFEAQNPGLRLLRHLRGPDGPYEKPTSHALQVLAGGATRGTADLRDDEVFAFLRGEPVRRRFPGLHKGYAIARFGGYVLGCALVTSEGLVSQIPEAHGLGVRSSLFLAPGGPGGA